MKLYPTKDELKKIAEWEGDWISLLNYVYELWHTSGKWNHFKGNECFQTETNPSDPLSDTYELCIGGVSGNEDLVYALKDNKSFWLDCWESSHRGGKYVFTVNHKPSTLGGNSA